MSFTASMQNWGPVYQQPGTPVYVRPDYGLMPGPSAPAPGLQINAESWRVPGLQGTPSENMGVLDWLKSLNWQDQYNDIGQKTGQGISGSVLGAVNSIFNAYMGLKQYGLAKDQFAENKRQFGLNYDAQRRTTNAALADRQAARIDASPNAGFASVVDYMSRYGIPGG